MKKSLANLARVLVSLGILAYLFHGIFQKEAAQQVSGLNEMPWGERFEKIWTVGPRVLGDVFQQVHPLWFLLAVACVGVVVLCGVVRWRWILQVQGLHLPWRRAFAISFIGLFFNTFMLGATGGDVMKAWYAAHETHHKKAEAVATVIVDRIVGLFVLFVIALVMMLLFWHRVYDDVRLRTFTMITLAFVLGTVTLTALSFWKGFADHIPGLRWLLQLSPRYETLRRMVEACRVYASHPDVIAKTTAIGVAVHGFSMLAIVCVGKGLGITSATLTDYFIYLPIINSISAIPITISGFGVREGMYVTMFGRVGVPGAAALALSLLGYIANLFWSIVGALFYLTHRKELPPADQLKREEE